MSLVTTYRTTLGSHAIEVEFDKTLQVLNRARLLVDGTVVDKTRVVYGDKDLTADLDDGGTVLVRLHSGGVGELTRLQIQTPDGSWSDLTPSD